MEWVVDLVKNPILITAVASWGVAQVLKVIINAIINKELSIERLFGDGGMPSGHSATVTSMATITALTYGTGSVEFAICAILAIIVCHDATGVRQETGKQAVLLNELIEAFEALSKADLPEVKLKEFVGHTPIQVIAGILLGIVDALVIYFCVL